jgi:HEAT repeat protein
MQNALIMDDVCVINAVHGCPAWITHFLGGLALRYLAIMLLLVYATALAQAPSSGPVDVFDLARQKNFGAYRSSSNNLYVDSNDDSKHPLPGETIVLADLKGPGIVSHVWVTVADNEYAWPRLLRLRVYYDGRKTPSVDAPLGDFFGVGHGYERNLNSMMVRNASFGRARNEYWPMPFLKSVRITITNEGKRRLSSLYYHVDWQKYDSLPPDITYFHAHYRQATPPPRGQLFTLLNINGTGHYVGSVLNIIQTQMGWFGEGDDVFYVDGEKVPRSEGTGTEDYFNDAWALRVSDGAWTGVPVAEGEGFGARLTGYRWHVPDPAPFKKSLRVAIEHLGWTYNPDGTARSGFEERSDFFSSVAFWYQKGVNEDLPELPYGYARLPFGNAQQIEVENDIARVTTEKGQAEVQKEVFWSKDLLFLKAQGEGSKINIPFDVQQDAYYEIIAQIAQAPDYGDYVATLDGKQTNSTMVTWGPLENQGLPVEVLYNYEPEIFVGIDHRLGWFDLSKGKHVLTLTCVGKNKLSSGYNIGVDGIVLSEIENGDAMVHSTGEGLSHYETIEPAIPMRAPSTGIVYRGKPLNFYIAELQHALLESRLDTVRAIGAFGEDAASAVGVLVPLMGERDPDTRFAVAKTLGEIGPKAQSAAPTLGKLLSDNELQVREAAALALRDIGPGSVAALPQLTAALKDPAPTVGMAAALAIGQMRDAAKPAVPQLIAEIQATDQKQLSNAGVQVLRNIARALGEIGPAAKDAVPALKTVQHLRVKYLAEEAIAKIEGNPTPTWH